MTTFVVQIDDNSDGWSYRVTHPGGVTPDGPFRNVGALIDGLARFLIDFELPEETSSPPALGVSVSDECIAGDRFGG